MSVVSRRLAIVIAIALGASACAGDEDPEAAPVEEAQDASSTATVVAVLPEPVSVDVTLVQEGLVDPVPVEGEPVRVFTGEGLGDSQVAGATTLWIQIRLAPDWYARSGSTYCAWTEQRGFFDCRGGGTLPSDRPFALGVQVPPGDDALEWWLTGSGGVGLRRLVRIPVDDDSGDIAVELAEGYDTVNDALSRQPPQGGNYLVPADADAWVWPVAVSQRARPALVDVSMEPVVGMAHVDFPVVERGVLAKWSEVDWERQDADPSLAPLGIHLSSCSQVAPNALRIDGRVEPSAPLEFPVTVDLGVSLTAGDIRGGFAVEATFEAAGDFAFVRIESAVREDGLRQRWGAGARRPLGIVGQGCHLESLGPRRVETSGYGEVVEAPGVLQVMAPTGSVESLVTLVDTTDLDDPLLPLAYLLLEPGWERVDRLWLNPTAAMDSIQINQEGACREVATNYRDPEVRTVQGHGCPEVGVSSTDDHIVAFDDGQWETHIYGSRDAVEQFVTGLAVVPFANEPLLDAESSFDAVSYLAEWYDGRPELSEFDRFEFRDGLVSIWLTVDDRGRIQISSVEAFSGATGGSSGMFCIDVAAASFNAGDGGYAVLLAREPATRAEYEYLFEPATVDLELSADGFNYAIVELPPDRDGWDTFTEAIFFDETGEEIPCRQ